MPCDECKFDATAKTDDELVEMLAGFARKYQAPLTRGLPGEDLDVIVRTRPEPGVWSPLEYCAHVVDVIAFYEARVERVVNEDRPLFDGGNLPSNVVRDAYNDLDPATVATTLAEAATRFADRLRSLDAGDWQAIGIGSEGDERSVRVLVERCVHDAFHHLLDVGRGLRAARGR